MADTLFEVGPAKPRSAGDPSMRFSEPPANVTPTSQAAAAKIAPTAGTLRAAVLAFITARGTAGATDEEMQLQIPMNPSTQRPRRQELQEAGLIRQKYDAASNAVTRETKSGRKAVVWVVK
jgi:hypothetical protein